MTWYSIMGFVSSFALFIPIALMLVLKLAHYRTFPALLIYYSSVFIYNLLTEGYLQADRQTIYYWGLINNLLDAPLMMTFLTYFSLSKEFTKKMYGLIAAYVLFELIVIAIFGLTVKSITIVLAPGLIMVAAYCLYFFIRNGKAALQFNKCVGKSFMSASLFFAYGSYAMIYTMYYIFRTPYVADTFLIYFMAATISAIFMGIGLYYEKKRVRKLQELLITRRELSEFYKDEKKGARLRAPLLDFENDILC